MYAYIFVITHIICILIGFMLGRRSLDGRANDRTRGAGTSSGFDNTEAGATAERIERAAEGAVESNQRAAETIEKLQNLIDSVRDSNNK